MRPGACLQLDGPFRFRYGSVGHPQDKPKETSA